MTARWFFARNQQKFGPFSFPQLKQLAECGFLQSGEHVLLEGSAKWVEAQSVPGLIATPEQAKYWLSVGGKTCGPYVAEQIRAGLTTRQFNMDTQVFLDKTKAWVPLRQATEFHGYEPGTVSRSQAQLLAGSLDLEEARLHLAGKEGDELAELMSKLLDLKRIHENKPDLAEAIDRSLTLLRQRRDQPPAVPAKPEVKK